MIVLTFLLGGYILPFLLSSKKKSQSGSGLITKHMTSEGKITESGPESDNEMDGGLEMIAEQMIKAFETKDAKRLANLLKAAFEMTSDSSSLEGPSESMGE